MSIADKITAITENTPKVYSAGYDIGYTEGYEKGYDKGMEESGSSDNLVTPPENAVEGYAFTVNTDGTVTVDAYSESTAVMLYREEIDFLPMENGKKYKLTITPSVEVSGKADMRWRNPEDPGRVIYAFEMDFTEGNSVIFTTPDAPSYVETLHLPCFSDKTVTYTFDLREVLDEGVIYEDGFKAGKKAEYDTFWDIYQECGNRANYSLAFAGNGWTDITYKPKYDIKPTNATQMYYGAMIKEIGIDFSDCTNFSQCFAQSSVEVIDTVDMRKCTVASSNLYTFWATKLHTINKLIVDSTVPFNKNFLFNAVALVNLTIEGDIGQDGFDIHWSKLLSRDSIESIINALSSSEMGLTVTLSETAVNNAFTEGEWTELANTKNNWNIYLV